MRLSTAASRPAKKPFKARLSIALAWIIGQCLRVIPRELAYRLSDLAGNIFYYLFPTYRANVRSNMSYVLGPSASAAEIDRVTREVFRTSARNFYDLLKVPHLSAADLRAEVRVSYQSWEHLDSALAEGKGAVILTAHLGAFDYVGQILSFNGYDMTALTTRTVPEFIATAVDHLRASRGLQLEQATPGGVRRAMLTLRRGGVVGLVADRDFFQSGLPTVFFGGETTLPPGPIRMARQTGAPIVPGFARRLRRGCELVLGTPFKVARTNDPERDVAEALARIVQIYEEQISQAPGQWVMFQRGWPEEPTPAPPLRVFPIGSPLGGELLGRGSDTAAPLTQPSDASNHHDAGPSAAPKPEPATRRARQED